MVNLAAYHLLEIKGVVTMMPRVILTENDEKAWSVVRILAPHTSEEDARRIHEYTESELLARDHTGQWLLCVRIQEAIFTDVQPIVLVERETESNVDKTTLDGDIPLIDDVMQVVEPEGLTETSKSDVTT